MEKDLLKFLESENILITGAEGFIGSHLVKRLVNYKANIIATAPSLGWRPWFIELVRSKKIKFLKVDVLTKKGLEKLNSYISNIDLVIHMARVWANGVTMLQRSSDEAERNLLGTIRFFSFITQYVSDIIYPSSIEIYGIPDKLPIKECCSVNPISPYGVAKLAVENFLKVCSSYDHLNITILRYSTIYGIGELEPRAVPNFIRSALKNESPIIYSNGQDIRDYIFMDDVINATIKSIIERKKGLHIYNVGSGVGYSTNDLANIIIKLVGSKVKPVHKKITRQPIKIICDIEKIKNDIGYSHKFSLEEGLSKEIQWFRENVNLWNK